jgi:hypothetical protein
MVQRTILPRRWRRAANTMLLRKTLSNNRQQCRLASPNTIDYLDWQHPHMVVGFLIGVARGPTCGGIHFLHRLKKRHRKVKTSIMQIESNATNLSTSIAISLLNYFKASFFNLPTSSIGMSINILMNHSRPIWVFSKKYDYFLWLLSRYFRSLSQVRYAKFVGVLLPISFINC